MVGLYQSDKANKIKIEEMKCKKFRPSLKDFLKAMDKAEREIRLQSETGFQRKTAVFRNKKKYSRKSKHSKRSLGFFYLFSELNFWLFENFALLTFQRLTSLAMIYRPYRTHI